MKVSSEYNQMNKDIEMNKHRTGTKDDTNKTVPNVPLSKCIRKNCQFNFVCIPIALVLNLSHYL